MIRRTNTRVSTKHCPTRRIAHMSAKCAHAAREREALECERGREGGEEQERADRPHRGEWCPTEEEEGLENELLWDPFGDG